MKTSTLFAPTGVFTQPRVRLLQQRTTTQAKTCISRRFNLQALDRGYNFGESLRKRIAEARTPGERERLEKVLAAKIEGRNAKRDRRAASIGHEAFATPNWSVRSLLPSDTSTSSSSTSTSTTLPDETTATTKKITPETLNHLLRLSALPPPASEAEQAAMLSTLETQLHFVRDIQTVDTKGVEPLRVIRDETSEGVERETKKIISAADAALKREVKFGFHERPRRVADAESPLGSKSNSTKGLKGVREITLPAKQNTESIGHVAQEYEDEEALVEEATRTRRESGYFVVDSGKAKRGE